ncbi:MAG: zf-HC2 domain-containing protein [Archangium sp.]
MSHVDSLITDVLTGRMLAPEDDAAFRAHVRSCERCRAKYDEALTVLRLARGNVNGFAPGELQRIQSRAAWASLPVEPKRFSFAWPFGLVGAAVAVAALLMVLLAPRTPVGRVLVASKGLTLDGVVVGKDAVIYEDTVIGTDKEDAAVIIEGARGRRGVLLRPNTRLRVSASDDATLQSGRVRVQAMKAEAPFTLRSGTSRIVQSAPGVFITENKDSGTLVAVHQGNVNVSAPGGSVEVKESQQTEIVGGAPGPVKTVTANALVEDRGDGTVWDAIVRWFRQLIDTIGRALAGQ